MPANPNNPRSAAQRLAAYARARANRPATTIPGAGSTGRVLTGQAAIAAAQTAYAQATSQYGELMGLMGRKVPQNRVMLQALQSAVGKLGVPIFKETPLGGMLGLQLGGEENLIPTQWGPFLLVPSKTSPFGVSLKAASTKEGLEATQIIAESLSKQYDLKTSSVRIIRQEIRRQIRALGGGKDVDANLLAAATGHHIDLLRAAHNFDPAISNILGKYPDPKKVYEAVQHLTSRGVSTLLDKPEAFLKGFHSTLSYEALNPFGMFASGGRQLYQTQSFAPLIAGDVEAFEVARFGRRMPRVRTRGQLVWERALGGEMPQGITSRIGVVSPYSALGRKLSQGLAGGTEAAFISRRLAGIRYLLPGAEGAGAMAAASTVERLGLGTAISAIGQKFNVAGLLSDKLAEEVDLLVVADIAKDKAQYLKTMYSDTILNSLNQSTGRLKKGVSQIADALGLGTISTTGIKGLAAKTSVAMLNMSKTLKELGFGTARKLLQKFALRATGRSPLTPVATSLGPMLKFTGEFHVRANMPIGPFWKGLKVTPMDMMGMASMGKSSAEVAQRLLSHAIAHKGGRARALTAFLNPFLGRNLPSNLFKAIKGMSAFTRVGAGQIDPRLPQLLQNIRNVADLKNLVSILPKSNLALQFSQDIRVPTFEYFKNVADPRNIATWAKWRQAGVSTKELALPSLQGLRGLLSRITAEGRAEDAPVFLSKSLAATGRVIEKYLAFEAGPTEASRLALEEAVGIGPESLLARVTSHTGKGRMWAKAFHPRLGKGAYGVIQTGFAERFAGGLLRLPGQAGLLPKVGQGEVGISEQFARQLGLSENKIGRIIAGREKFFVGGQYYPSVVPETSRVYRLKVFTESRLKDLPGAERLIVTNVADRTAAFRDLDFDRMMLYIFPSTVRQKLLRKAHKAQVQRLSALWSRMQANISNQTGTAALRGSGTNRALARAIGLSEEETAKLFGQKVLSPKYHSQARLLQELVQRKFGPDSADTLRAIGVAYQIAGIKKGQGGVYDELFTLAESMGKHAGDLSGPTKTLTNILQNLGEKGRASNIFLGFNQSGYEKVSSQALTAMQEAAGMTSSQKASILARITSGKPLDESGLLGLLSSVERSTGAFRGIRQDYYARLSNLGQRVVETGIEFANASLEAVNTAAKSAGAGGKAAGGIWATMGLPWKIGLGIAGGLVGLRMIKSALIGDEPSAPLPPEPIGQPGGMHESLASAPMPMFDPPTARVISPLQRSPRVTMSGTAPRTMDFGGLGDQLALAARSPAGSPLAGVYASNNPFDTSRIDMSIEEDLRLENRLYT